MTVAAIGPLLRCSVFQALCFLIILCSVLAGLATGLYPAFRGKDDLWFDVIANTPSVVRLLAASTLTILAFSSWRLITGARDPHARDAESPPSVVPVAISGLILAGCIVSLQGGFLDSSDPSHVSLSIFLWLLLFAISLRLAHASLPVLSAPRDWTTSVLVGAAAALGPKLDVLLPKMLIEPTLWLVKGWLGSVDHGNVLIRRDSERFVSINVDGFEVGIADSCAGYDGATLALLLVGACVWFNKDRLIFPRALIVFPLVAGGMFLLNSIRIFVLIMIGAHISPAIAVEGFHIYAGWMYLITMTLTACVWLETSRWLSRDPQLGFTWRKAFGANQSNEAVLIVPLIAFLILSILLGAFSTKLNWLYPVTVTLGGMIAWPYARHHVQALSGFEGHAVALGCAVAVIWFVLVPDNPDDTAAVTAELFAAPAWAIPIWILLRMAGAVLVVPVVEELGFRGAIQGQLIETLKGALGNWGGVAASIGLTAVMFGLLHSAVIAGTLAGVCYGWLRYHSGSLSAPILAHAVTNFIISMYVLITGTWSYW